MTAARHDFIIEQGATFREPLLWKDEDGVVIDTSGYAARMQVRQTVSTSTTLAEFTTENGRISLGIVGTGADQYNILLTMTATDTAALDTNNRVLKGVYDLELSGGGVVTRVLEGEVRFSPEVTR